MRTIGSPLSSSAELRRESKTQFGRRQRRARRRQPPLAATARTPNGAHSAAHNKYNTTFCSPATSPRRPRCAKAAPPWRSRAAPPAILDQAAAAVALVVTARRGLVVRAGVELKSAEVAKLDKGVRCLVDEERDSDGKRRVRLINPIKGWASRKMPARGVGRGSESDGVRALGRRRRGVDTF